MVGFSKIFTGSVAALALAGTIAATPASAGGYYYRSGPNPGAVAGAAIAGMAVGAMVGAVASQPRYYDDPYPAYAYSPRYGYRGGSYGW